MSMPNLALFPDLPASGPPSPAKPGPGAAAEPPRLLRPQRAQLYLRTCDYESLLPQEHLARLLWAALERLDLSAFLARIEARGSEPGRPAIDPAIVIALLLYGRCEGIVNAREIERRCERDDAYRWICGGVSVNHHLLSDYDSKLHAEVDGLFNQLLAVLSIRGWSAWKGAPMTAPECARMPARPRFGARSRCVLASSKRKRIWQR